MADIHLGYSWAQRRKGELGPLADEKAKAKLIATCGDLQPQRVVFLGDIVHAPKPCAPERVWIEELLSGLARRLRVVVVRGNHDRAFAREFGHLPVETAENWTSETSNAGGITALHGDRLAVPLPENHVIVLGHLHPSLAVKDPGGAGNRLPLFLVNRHAIVLPAFSPFARGYEVSRGLPDDIARLFRDEPIEAIAVSGTRAVRLGSLDAAIRKLEQRDANAPANFQGRHRRRSPDR